jgi:hypothetical protein
LTLLTRRQGQTPDKHSPTLRQYHKLLWSKPLPSGRLFSLSDARLGGSLSLHHRSELGEFFLTSDGIIHTFTRWGTFRHIAETFPEEENEAFHRIGSTIGARIVFPGNRIDKKNTINGARGFPPLIKDRFDLTLECIRRHHLKQDSPLREVLARYQGFFALFASSSSCHSTISELLPCQRIAPLMRITDGIGIEFVEARSRRIEEERRSRM